MRRILIVDDEPHVTRLVQQKLRSEGYDAVTAGNGLEALARLESEGPFHAVVTDYNMPKMDGRQLCESIRARYSNQELYIFLVTARPEKPVRAWAEGMPRVEYIEKPISLQDLLRRLAKCFAPTVGSEERCDED